MAFRLFSVFITVLISLNFGEVKSLDCATWCSKENCDHESNKHYKELCWDAKSKCDCSAASYEQLKELVKDSVKFKQLLGLVLGVTFLVIIVGIIGCCCVCREIKQLNPSAGAPGGAIYQPSPSRMNYGYQPGGAGPPPMSYGPPPTGSGSRPLSYTNPTYPTTGPYIPPNAVP